MHLQLYDGEILSYRTQKYQYTNSPTEAPHILPVLFSFTTPAKFCFRAIASFSKFVTEMAPPTSPIKQSSSFSMTRQHSLFGGFKLPSPRPDQTMTVQTLEETEVVMLEGSQTPDESPPRSSRKSLRRALSSQLSRVSSMLRGQPPPVCDSPPGLLGSPLFAEVNTSPVSDTHENSPSSDDVAGPRFQMTAPVEPVERTAGDPLIYSSITVCFFIDKVPKLICDFSNLHLGIAI